METLDHKTTTPTTRSTHSATRPEVETTGAAAPAAPPKLGRWALIVLALFAGGLAFSLLPRLSHQKQLVKDTREMAIASVNVINPAPGKATSSLVLPAEVRPVVEAPIYARASGFLKKWHVDIGGQVEAGQLLADIDAPELDQELTGARAGLAQAEAALALAKTTAARWAELLKTSSVSEQENAEKQADLALKTANVDAAKANVRRLEELESFTHVIAPFAGTITTRAIDTGDLITSGKELFRLADTRTLRVFVRVPQSGAPGIVPGLEAELVVPEMPGRQIAAKVVRTAGAIDANSRTLLTELEVANPRNEILAGSYAQVSFMDSKQDLPLVLPSNTLIFRSDGLQVGVVGPDGRVELRNITLGRDFGRSVEVVAGVSAHDRVVMNPSDSLISGATVTVAQASAPVMAEKTK